MHKPHTPVTTPARRPTAPALLTLRELRIKAGLTLPELANRAGLSKATLSMIERGRMSPNEHETAKLEAALNVKLTLRVQLVAEAPQ